MPNLDLINYIESQLLKGVDREQLKATLLEHKWDEKAINESLAIVESNIEKIRSIYKFRYHYTFDIVHSLGGSIP